MNPGLSKDVIEEVRIRCDIVELIGSFVQLKRSGSHTFKGLCPFHQEKTPSFHVDSSRQMFHCFGCGKGGDVFRFYMDKENVGFGDALRMLAGRVGVVVPERGEGAIDPALARRNAGERERLFQVNDVFANYFRRFLVDHPDSPAAQYLAKRGIPPEVAETFKIGACPDDWTACLNYGRSLKFSDAELVKSGVVSRKEETGRCYDHFKGRLTFAIENEQGRVVGFSARSLEAKPLAGGKYINTPETPVFKKGNLLYALPLARKMMGDTGMTILCEGQLDVIAFHRAGYTCAVAPQGTAFTEDQARILKRYCSRIYLALDADTAGQKAALRDIEILLPLSFDIRVIRIPGGKDPDELFQNGGAEAVKAAVDSAVTWLPMVCESLSLRHDMASPAGRGQAAREVIALLRLIGNQIEQQEYLREAARLLNTDETALWGEMRQIRYQAKRDEERRASFRTAQGEAAPPPPPKEPEHPAALRTLLTLAVHYEEAAREIADLVPSEELPEDAIGRAINLAVNSALNGEFNELPARLAEMLHQQPSPAVSAAMVGDHAYADVGRAVRDTAGEWKRLRLAEKRNELMQRMRQAATPEEREALLRAIAALPRR